MRNADGTLAIGGRQTMPRVVYKIFVSEAFSGVMGPYPEFEQDRGVIYTTPHGLKINKIDGSRVPNSAGGRPSTEFAINTVAVPNFVWNDSTKEVTITAAPTYGGLRSNWSFIFVHYR